MLKILLVKESRAGELRVALVPKDVSDLVAHGYEIIVEHDAGKAAGFIDDDYIAMGASIRDSAVLTKGGYQTLFEGIDIVVRAKRPESSRERLENIALTKGMLMIGALDPLEKKSPHIGEYQKAGIFAYSIDQLVLDAEDPMNVLSAMSKMAGQLALKAAMKLRVAPVEKVVIIGFGVVGQSAFNEAKLNKFPVTVVLTNVDEKKKLAALGIDVVLMNREKSLAEQQGIVKKAVMDADIVIASARRANQLAPLLIPTEILENMQSGAVVVDMALSEGGNVEGSEHDQTRTLANGVLVTNTSGYPKVMPREASVLWSRASKLFLLALDSERKSELDSCLIGI